MTHNGFNHWFNRTLGYHNDDESSSQMAIEFYLKSGAVIKTDMGSFFEFVDIYMGSDNIVIHPIHGDEPTYEVDIDSIEFIKW